jgi:hypothetical protein
LAAFVGGPWDRLAPEGTAHRIGADETSNWVLCHRPLDYPDQQWVRVRP